MTQIVRPRKIIARGGKNSLQRLLRRLLSVEAHSGVCDIGVRHELPDDINRDSERRESIAQTHHLAQLAVQALLDYEEIQVAVLTRVSTRP
jgi:uncharacterized FAD-dependent dehydrogenase